MRTAEKWRTDKWFVSPWNFDPAVTDTVAFPKRLLFHDVTLRDGEQQAGLVFRKDDKIRIAEKLAEVGIHRIEAGMPAVSREDEAAIRDIVKRNLGPKVFCFARCMVDDVRRAADCGAHGVVVEIPSSEHIIEHAYRWSLQKAIDLSVEATTLAKELGLYTVFFPIDGSRADLEAFITLVDSVAKAGHMDALAVVDTFGGLAPSAIPHLVRVIRSHISKPLEAHFHDDFGMAAANTVLAVACGVEVVHTTVTSAGERAGNAAYEDVALALTALYGFDTGLNLSKVVETSRLVRELAGSSLDIPSNRPIVGERIYKVESGIIASWLVNCGDEHLLELFPFRPELVGHTCPEIVLGKNSGMDSIRYWLGKLGLSATDDQHLEILLRVKAKSHEKKGLLTQAEFEHIVEAVLGEPQPGR